MTSPKTDDCVITQLCEQDIWYPKAGVDQSLAPLPSWSSENTECAGKFVQVGGYGEMSVIGRSIECEDIDDGHADPFIFYRTGYCPPSCVSTPDTPSCQACRSGGSGMFDP